MATNENQLCSAILITGPGLTPGNNTPVSYQMEYTFVSIVGDVKNTFTPVHIVRKFLNK